MRWDTVHGISFLGVDLDQSYRFEKIKIDKFGIWPGEG
jgi:hypothetical protein